MLNKIKSIIFLITFFFNADLIFAKLSLDLDYMPLQFTLSSEKESYREGEKISLLLEIKNKSSDSSYPILLPHTQNSGLKLIYLKIYDKTNNVLLEREAESRQINMPVHDTGNVMIKWLMPNEQIVIPIYLNDIENNNSNHAQINSHHSFGVPLFAGTYKVLAFYNPKGIPAGDNLYKYSNGISEDIKSTNKLRLSDNGTQSNFFELNIRKAPEGVIEIEGKKYFTLWKDGMFWYYTDSIGEGGSNPRLVHLTNLPIDSSTVAKGEYFYSHFVNKYAEYIKRSDNGDILEYRKYRDVCPEELLAYKFNDLRQKVYYAEKLADGRFYNISYLGNGQIHQEQYYSADGTECEVIDYIYNKKNELLRKKTTMTQPCIYSELDGKSYRKTVAE